MTAAATLAQVAAPKVRPLPSPLRYPGGKSKALPYLAARMPDVVTQYVEPFLGGGSVALYVTARYPTAKVWVNDAYKPLWAFWSVLRDRPSDLIATLLRVHKLTLDIDVARVSYDKAMADIADPDLDVLELAAAYYFCNRLGFSGIIGSALSASSHARWIGTEGHGAAKRIDKLAAVSAQIQGWEITNLDFAEVMRGADAGVFIYADPPYNMDRPRLYGCNGSMHRGFDHDDFVDAAHAAMADGADVMVSYDKSMLLTFATWPTCHLWDLDYCLQSEGQYRTEQVKKQELLVLSYLK